MDGGNSRKHILSAVEGSLRRLGTDYIDLYQLHGYDRNTPIDETLSALDDLVHSGKVRYIGCSNFLTYQLVRADRPERDAPAGPVRLGAAPLQPAVPPDRAGDAAVLRRGRRRRDLLQPDRGRAAVGQAQPVGAAAGRQPVHARQRGPMYQQRYWHERMFDTVEALRKLADEAGVSLVTLSVAWVLANKAITAPIIGASRPDQLDASLAAADLRARPRPEAAPRRPHPRLPPGRRRPVAQPDSSGNSWFRRVGGRTADKPGDNDRRAPRPVIVGRWGPGSRRFYRQCVLLGAHRAPNITR